MSAAPLAVKNSGDLRQLTLALLSSLMKREIATQDAAVVLKGIKEINVSLYSEIKHMALLLEMKRVAPDLGELPLFQQLKKK